MLGEEDGLLLLFGDEDGALAGGAHGGDEEVIADDVELLLVVAGGVGGAGQTSEVDEGSTTDVVGDGFEGELEGVAEETVEGFRVDLAENYFEKGLVTYVKSPVASACFTCSSVRKRVSVTISVLIFSVDPLSAMIAV